MTKAPGASEGVCDRGRARSGGKALVARLALAVWAPAMLGIGTVLMAGHWVRLPTPEVADPTLTRAITALHPGEKRWQLVHVLSADCPCSRRIIDYLLQRPPPTDASDSVVLVGAGSELGVALRGHGISVEQIEPEELQRRFGIQSVPLLVVVDPRATLRYVGGHTERKQGLDYQDISILARLRADEVIEPLSVFGCAVSRELQSYLDPIGIKYRTRGD